MRTNGVLKLWIKNEWGNNARNSPKQRTVGILQDAAISMGTVSVSFHPATCSLLTSLRPNTKIWCCYSIKLLPLKKLDAFPAAVSVLCLSWLCRQIRLNLKHHFLVFPSSSINSSGWFYFQVAKFPFKGNMSFVVIVPNQYTWNTSHVLENFPYGQLCRLFPKEVPTTVKIPKITLDYQLELNSVLSHMGKASNRICAE